MTQQPRHAVANLFTRTSAQSASTICYVYIGRILHIDIIFTLTQPQIDLRANTRITLACYKHQVL